MKKAIILFFPLLLAMLMMGCQDKQELIEYYPDGTTIKAKYFMINGKREGLYQEFDKSGKILYEFNYVNDQRHGSYYSYHENGNVFVKGQFSLGCVDGSFYYYNEENKLDSVIEYIVFHEDESVLDFLERDSITKEVAKAPIFRKNTVIIYDESGNPDIKKSLYYQATFDSIVSNDSMSFILSFTNPHEYYNYKSDSVEVLTFLNSIKNNKDVGYRLLSRDGSIHITGKHSVGIGDNTFCAIITLHHFDGRRREVLVKAPFLTVNESTKK